MIEARNKTRSKIDLALAKRIIFIFLKVFKKEKHDVSLAFVGDVAMQKLNQKYRNLNKPTDVLSFEGDDELLGEVIIDYAQIKRQAKKFNHSEKEELIFILVHGLLHLVGYDDSTEKGAEKMDKTGKEFIKNYILLKK